MKIFLEKAWFGGQKEYRGERVNDFSALRAIQAGRDPRRALVQPSALRGSALGSLWAVQGFLCSGLGNLKGWRLTALFLILLFLFLILLPWPYFCQGLDTRNLDTGNQEKIWPVVAFETILFLWRGRNVQLWGLGGQSFITCPLCFGRVFIQPIPMELFQLI